MTATTTQRLAQLEAQGAAQTRLMRLLLEGRLTGELPNAAQLAAFQREDGGYWFGRKDGEWLPFSNPVSTAFASQALESWSGSLATRQLLI